MLSGKGFGAYKELFNTGMLLEGRIISIDSRDYRILTVDVSEGKPVYRAQEANCRESSGTGIWNMKHLLAGSHWTLKELGDL